MATIFADSTQNQTEAIQAWVMERINERMTFAGRAVDFMNNLDQEQKKVVDNVDIQVSRINSVVSEFNLVKGQLRATHLTIEEKVTKQ